MPDAKPVIYEAMPKSGYWPSRVTRDLTASLSVSPGVWQWPPANEGLGLHSGTNEVNIEVLAVDGPLVGESVELRVNPALGFKNAMPNVQWLWWSFLWWPIMFPIQVLWAVGLVERNLQDGKDIQFSRATTASRFWQSSRIPPRLRALREYWRKIHGPEIRVKSRAAHQSWWCATTSCTV